MAHLARLTEHDRYQASLGIERAAAELAAAATALGLVDVTIERFAADGATRWWTFQGPRAWTPTTAQLEVRAGGRTIVAIDHAVRPFTIATYSAPTPAAGLIARLARVDDAALAGAVVVIGAADFARPTLLATLAAHGALGFVTDATSRGATGEHVGRIELDAATTLFGFSVTTAQRVALEDAAGEGAEAHVRIAIDRSAGMPVVTGVLPGRGPHEVWLTSHLCHPRPGANDNASGSAALLGVAASLIDQQAVLDRSVRFVWGPEFVGVAALLHQRDARLGSAGRPVAVLNLDMVGEDPAQCGVPLVVERPPDWVPSVIGPLAEQVVERVFAHTATHPGSWRPGPFLGYSDHALFATSCDSTWWSPAVQLWHPGDPFNHSAADTLDKVAPIELLRATAAGAVLAALLACDDDDARAVREDAVARWCAREATAADAVARRYQDAEDGAWSRRFVEHVARTGAAMRGLVDDEPAAWQPPHRPRGGAFVGRWAGPFNLRAMLAAVGADTRADVAIALAADKRTYAVATHLALWADVCASRDEAIERTSMGLRAPIDRAVAARVWSALLESGWIEATDGDR